LAPPRYVLGAKNVNPLHRHRPNFADQPALPRGRVA
jgi:hypothetical protein